MEPIAIPLICLKKVSLYSKTFKSKIREIILFIDKIETSEELLQIFSSTRVYKIRLEAKSKLIFESRFEKSQEYIIESSSALKFLHDWSKC